MDYLLTDDELLGNYYDKASPLDKDTLIEGLREVAKAEIDYAKPLIKKDERERIINIIENGGYRIPPDVWQAIQRGDEMSKDLLPPREEIIKSIIKKFPFGVKTRDIDFEAIELTNKDQLDKVKQELCANCDTPLLREGELYQKLEQARKDERERIIREVEQLWRPQHHNLCYGSKPHPDCIRCKWQALKGEK